MNIILRDKSESLYSCMCCYLSCYDNLNPIVYCDLCDGGAHQRCYGIEDIEEPFFCDLCQLRKKRQDIDNGDYDKSKLNLVCIICNKSGGMMKCDSHYKKNTMTYFHPFCIFTSSYAYYKNVYTLKQIAFDLPPEISKEDSESYSSCHYCKREEPNSDGVLETCHTCKKTMFHAFCAWLHGCNFILD